MNSGISEVGDVGIRTELDSAVPARSRVSGDLLSLRASATREPAFFIPDVARGDIEQTYELIRADAEARTGQSISERRIASLACRRSGTDYEAKVGGRDALGGDVVVAIFELGRNVYAICCAESGSAENRAWADPIVVGKNQIYSVTEFVN